MDQIIKIIENNGNVKNILHKVLEKNPDINYNKLIIDEKNEYNPSRNNLTKYDGKITLILKNGKRETGDFEINYGKTPNGLEKKEVEVVIQ